MKERITELVQKLHEARLETRRLEKLAKSGDHRTDSSKELQQSLVSITQKNELSEAKTSQLSQLLQMSNAETDRLRRQLVELNEEPNDSALLRRRLSTITKENEISKAKATELEQQLQISNNEIQKLQRELMILSDESNSPAVLQRRLSSLVHESDVSKAKAVDLEEQLRVSTGEVIRLQQNLLEFDNELNDVTVYRERLSSIVKENEMSKAKADVLAKQLRESTNQVERLSKDLLAYDDESNNPTILKKRLSSIVRENEMCKSKAAELAQQLQASNAETEYFRVQLLEYESESNNPTMLRRRLSSVVKENDISKAKASDLEQQLHISNGEIEELQQKLLEFDDERFNCEILRRRLSLVVKENEASKSRASELAKQLCTSNAEVQRLQSSLMEFEDESNNPSALRKRLSLTLKENEISKTRASELTQQLQVSNAEIERLREQLMEFDEESNSPVILRQRLSSVANENELSKSIASDLAQQLRLSNAEIDRLQHHLMLIDQESNKPITVRSRLSSIVNENDVLKIRQNELSQQLSASNNEIERLRKQLMEFGDESNNLTMLRRRLSSLVKENEVSKARASDLAQQLDISNDEVAHLQEQLREFDDKSKSSTMLRKRLSSMSRENEESKAKATELAEQLRMANSEVEQLRIHLKECEEEPKNPATLRRRLSSVVQQNETSRVKACELAKQLQSSNDEVEYLQHQLSRHYDPANNPENLRRRLSSVMKANESSKAQALELSEQLCASNSEIERLQSQFIEFEDVENDPTMLLLRKRLSSVVKENEASNSKASYLAHELDMSCEEVADLQKQLRFDADSNNPAVVRKRLSSIAKDNMASKARASELAQQLHISNAEIERLQSALKKYEEETNDFTMLRKRLSSVVKENHTSRARASELLKQLNLSNNEVERLQVQMSEFTEESNNPEILRRRLSSVIRDNELSKTKAVELSQQLCSSNDEVERLRKHLERFDDESNNPTVLRKRLSSIMKENEQSKAIASDLAQQLDISNHEVAHLQEQLRASEDESNNSITLQKRLSAVVKENEESKAKASELAQQLHTANADVERLQNHLKEFDQESNNPTILRKKLSSILKENETSKAKASELAKQLQLSNNEVERLRTQVNKLDDESNNPEMLRRRLSSVVRENELSRAQALESAQRLQESNEETQRLRNLLQKLNEDAKNTAAMRALETENEVVKAKLSDLAQQLQFSYAETERLRKLLQKYYNETDNQDEIEQIVKESEETKAKLYTLAQELQNSNSEIERLQNVAQSNASQTLSSVEKENEELKKQVAHISTLLEEIKDREKPLQEQVNSIVLDKSSLRQSELQSRQSEFPGGWRSGMSRFGERPTRLFPPNATICPTPERCKRRNESRERSTVCTVS